MIQLDADTARAGRVTFDVNNAANGNTEHEFVVLRTDMDDARLPVHNGQVTESRFKKIGEVEDLARGSTKRLVREAGAGTLRAYLQSAGTLCDGHAYSIRRFALKRNPPLSDCADRPARSHATSAACRVDAALIHGLGRHCIIVLCKDVNDRCRQTADSRL